MKEIKVFCPATIANLSCGFDVLGVALDGVGDEMVVRKTSQKSIEITKITGQDLPKEIDKNVAGVAAKAFLKKSKYSGGFGIEIHKKIKPGSGIGSSAASSAGVVWAMNELLQQPFSKKELVEFAMQGEQLASNVAHADNVAPVIFGGFTLIRSYDPLDIIELPVPKELFAVILHPQIEIKTADSRKILKSRVSLKTGVKQWGNLGGLVAGLFKEDYELIGRSIQDYVIEPTRSILIPGFDEVKKRSLKAGALGCGISGSGPSIFALCQGKENAQQVAETMKKVYDTIGIDFEIHVSKLNPEGAKKIS